MPEPSKTAINIVSGERVYGLLRIVFFVLLFVFTCISLSKGLFSYEVKLGLPILYHARDIWAKPALPEEILVVTPYEISDFDTPENVRSLDRRDHAAAIDALVHLGARVVVVDIHFPLSKIKADTVLARAMREVQGLVLIQNARSRSLTKMGEKVYSLRNPVEPFPESASLMASPSVSAESAEVNRIPLFNLIWHDASGHECFAYPAQVDEDSRDQGVGSVLTVSHVPTLASSVLEQHLLLAMQDSEVHREWARSRLDEALSSRPACELMMSLRAAYIQGRMGDFPDFSKPADQRYLVRWQDILSKQRKITERNASELFTLQLNYFGPPESIQTVTYDHLEEMLKGNRENTVLNSTVFLGGSFKSAEDQKEDGYQTIYSSGSRMMSGVEINATAFANLVSNTGLRMADRWVSVGVLIGSTFILWLAATRLSMHWFSLVAIAELSIVVLLASWLFTQFQLWLPLATTLTLLLSLIVVTVIWRFRRSSQDRDRAVHHLNAFVSDTVVRQLDTGHNHVVEKAVCLVTDIRNFTAMGRKLKPGHLHMLNDAYFTHLFDCVSSEGVDVVKTYGDSLTAVWTSGSEEAVECAVRAGLKLLATTGPGTFSNDAGVETHIGMHRGELAIGFVGGDKQRTVEITGSTVYLASRLEQLNKVLNSRFLTTGDVRVLIHGHDVQSHGLHELKGFDSAVEVFEIGMREEAASIDAKADVRHTDEVY